MPAKKTTKPGPAPTSKVATKISPAREVAFYILHEIATSARAHSDDLLQHRKVQALTPQDRNLCTTLVMGVLRWQLVLDAGIAKLAMHKSRMDDPVRVALRLGAFQLQMLDRIPAHAAISDSVELTKRAGHRFASGLVNAILRKIALQAAEISEMFSSEAAHPEWLLARWQTHFGAAAAKQICDYDQQPPVATVRLVASDAEGSLAQAGIVLGDVAFLQAARCVVSGSAASSLALRDGAVRLQDEGSQLVAELLGGVPREVKSILDCCAAPGGKIAILAERYPSARVVAWDVSAHRLAAMQERFRSQPLLARIESTAGDATLMPIEERYDLILCDVPCSGTGTLARNPEIKLRLQASDLLRQQQRQVAILTAALRHLAVAGRLVYSTCSLEPEENERVVELVLAQSPGIAIVPVAERIGALLADGVLQGEGAAHLLERAVRGNFLRTIPGLSQCDGFFAAVLTRS